MDKVKALLTKSTSLILSAAILAVLGFLAVAKPTVVSGNTVWAVTMVVTGGGALLAGLVLGNPTQNNSQLLPHLILSLMLIGMILAMALENIFTGTQIDGFFYSIVGSGGTGVAAGAGYISATATSIPAQFMGAKEVPDAAVGDLPARPVAPGVPADQAAGE